MKRPHSSEILNLMAARHTARDQNCARFHRARGRQQASLANGARHVEVIAYVPKRSGHSTAAGVQIDNGRAGDAPSTALAGPRRPMAF